MNWPLIALIWICCTGIALTFQRYAKPVAPKHVTSRGLLEAIAVGPFIVAAIVLLGFGGAALTLIEKIRLAGLVRVPYKRERDL